MKQLVQQIFLLLFLVLVVPSPALTETADTVVTVEIDGMVCDFCARALEKTFKRHQEVAEISVDLSTKQVMIYLVDNATITDEAIQKAVTDAGYAVRKIYR